MFVFVLTQLPETRQRSLESMDQLFQLHKWTLSHSCGTSHLSPALGTVTAATTSTSHDAPSAAAGVTMLCPTVTTTPANWYRPTPPVPYPTIPKLSMPSSRHPSHALASYASTTSVPTIREEHHHQHGHHPFGAPDHNHGTSADAQSSQHHPSPSAHEPLPPNSESVEPLTHFDNDNDDNSNDNGGRNDQPPAAAPPSRPKIASLHRRLSLPSSLEQQS
jgi:hypothetical protein